MDQSNDKNISTDEKSQEYQTEIEVVNRQQNGIAYNTFQSNGILEFERKLSRTSQHTLVNVSESKSYFKHFPQLPDFFTKKQLNRKLPITEWLPKYNISNAVSDAIAGITVGLTVIPQGIAYAGVAELPAQVFRTFIMSLTFHIW